MPRRKRDVHIYLTITLLAAIQELLPAGHLVAQTTGYKVIELPSTGEVPSRLNSLGDVVGRAGNSPGGQTRATFWSHSLLQPKNLGALPGGDYSSASAINDAGHVAGASNTSNAVVPFIWKPTSGLQRIPLLSGDNCGQAFSINRYGHVAGYSSGPNGARAFLWTQSTGARNLGSLPGGTYSRAFDVNDLDQVAGISDSPAGKRAVLWTAGNIRNLGNLPGDTSSEATAINNAGYVVGYSKGPKGLRAFLWTEGAGMEDLGVLPGGDSSRALDINDLGDVVGSSTSSSGDHAFIWTREAGMTDLNSVASAKLDVVFVEARSINAAGEILVLGSPPQVNGGTVAPPHCAPAPPSSFLLIPTPAR